MCYHYSIKKTVRNIYINQTQIKAISVQVKMELKWGIASAGKISHDFVTALSTIPDGEHKVIAVAARQEESAKNFAALHNIPKYYEGYEKLAQDPDIDIVYIGVLIPQHYEVSVLMLDHGKHVLCEKPLCLNEKQAKKLLAHAKSKKLFFMEAMWARFFPSYQYLKKCLDNGDLGEIQEVHGTMIVPLSDVDRLQKRKLGGGTTIDMGIYPIQAVLWVFREFPNSIKATGTLNDDGVDTSMSAELTFSGNRKAYIRTDTSKFGGDENDLVIIGTKGRMTLHQIWSPIRLIDIDGSVKHFLLPPAKFEFFYWNTCGLRYEAIAVREALIKGHTEIEDVSHEKSLEFARIEDEIRRQIGVRYDADDEF